MATTNIINNVKQISFIASGLLIITTVFLFTKSSNVEASGKDGKKFDDWTVTCTKEDAKTNTPAVCLLSQQVNVTENNAQKPLALYQFGYIGSKKELKIILTLPLGVRLEPGTSVISSGQLLAPGKFGICTEGGCQAVADVSDADLKAILGSDKNAVAFMGSDGKQVSMPISVKGLSEGLKFIK